MRSFEKHVVVSILLALLISGCSKEVDPRDNIVLIEGYVRMTHDNKATFTYNQYEEILTILKENKFIVLPINELHDSVNSLKVLVSLRHDVDFHPFKALEMAKIENKFGFHGSYYILPTAQYYGRFEGSQFVRYSSMRTIYKKLSLLGAEVGIHNDYLTILLEQDMDPLEFSMDQKNFFESNNIPIIGTSAHGAPNILKMGLINYEIFSEYNKHPNVEHKGRNFNLGRNSLSDFDFKYEAYFVHCNKYFAESGGNFPNGFDDLKKQLIESRPGDRIQILTHPVWWGK